MMNESAAANLKAFRVGELDVLTWKRSAEPRQIVSVHNALTGDAIPEHQPSGSAHRKLRRALLQLQPKDFPP
jgi:hypothetical protein